MDQFRARVLRPVPFILVSLFALAPATAFGQEATPAAAELPDGVTIAARGLTNPRGFIWVNGTLTVALAGNGGLETNPAAPAPADEAPAADATPDLVADSAEVLAADQSGALVQVTDGCPVALATGLPSNLFVPLNWAAGVTDVAMLNGALYVLVDGGGEIGLHPDEPNGVYRVLDDGTTELVANLSVWFRENPVAEPTRDISPDGQPYAMVAGDGVLWISESNHEQILTVTPDGEITRFIDLSPQAEFGITVPTGLAVAPDGGLYVGFLTELPFVDGTAKVIKIAPDGTVSDAWTGLTAVTAIALSPDGTLHAVEMATGNTDTEPFYHPHTGKVVRQTGPDSSEEIATGLDYPVHLDIDPNGDLYVGGPAFGANGGEGSILRITPGADTFNGATISAAPAC